MSLTLNMVGGGSGGLTSTDAVLRVQSTAGSTVTISKGGITKSDQGHENASDTTKYDYYFIIHASQFDGSNPWTVTATLGNLSSSDTVIINSPDEYNVALIPLVPSEYQAVEYLQSSGTQYINIPDFYPTGETEFETTFLTTNVIASSGNFGGIFGARETYYLNGYCYTTYSEKASQKRGHFLYGSSSSSSVNNIRYDGRIVVNVKMTTVFHNHELSSDQFTGYTSVPAKTFTSPRTMDIFAMNSESGDGEFFRGNLYSLKFWTNSSTLAYDFIPCYRKSDSVAGLFDRVNSGFYTNNGSGTFVVGSDVK